MNMEYNDIKERVIAYLEDIYWEGDELFEGIVNNERCVRILDKTRPHLKHASRKYRATTYETTSRTIAYIYLNKENKRLISFQGQKAIVKDFNEAVEFINTLVNYKAGGFPIIANELCQKRLEKIFSNEWDGICKISARNTGGCPMHIFPALGDNIEEHTEAIKKYKLGHKEDEDE